MTGQVLHVIKAASATARVEEALERSMEEQTSPIKLLDHVSEQVNQPSLLVADVWCAGAFYFPEFCSQGAALRML